MCICQVLYLEVRVLWFNYLKKMFSIYKIKSCIIRATFNDFNSLIKEINSKISNLSINFVYKTFFFLDNVIMEMYSRGEKSKLSLLTY